MPKNYFDENIEYHDAESEGNGHGWEHEVNGHESGGKILHPIDPNSTQHLFKDATWFKSNNIYSPNSMPYLRGVAGLKNEFTCMPSYLCLFGFF